MTRNHSIMVQSERSDSLSNWKHLQRFIYCLLIIFGICLGCEKGLVGQVESKAWSWTGQVRWEYFQTFPHFKVWTTLLVSKSFWSPEGRHWKNRDKSGEDTPSTFHKSKNEGVFFFLKPSVLGNVLALSVSFISWLIVWMFVLGTVVKGSVYPVYH